MTTVPSNPEFDAYIANAAEFAKPVFAHLRGLIHEHCPAVVEAMKWGIPHFDYHGEMMCVFAAYGKHCSLTFLKQGIMSDPRLRANPGLPAARRFMGKLTSMADLPDDAELVAFLRAAMRLNEQQIKPPARPATTPPRVEMPAEFAEALAANDPAKAIFDSKPPSFQREYLAWVSDAKTEATRRKRIDQSLEWIAQGKGRFWKYQK